jgi:DNA-binding transcriptional regulator GbsR (MarR family)
MELVKREQHLKKEIKEYKFHLKELYSALYSFFNFNHNLFVEQYQDKIKELSDSINDIEMKLKANSDELKLLKINVNYVLYKSKAKQKYLESYGVSIKKKLNLDQEEKVPVYDRTIKAYMISKPVNICSISDEKYIIEI